MNVIIHKSAEDSFVGTLGKITKKMIFVTSGICVFKFDKTTGKQIGGKGYYINPKEIQA